MAQNPVQPDLRIIQLCARLAKFAYTSGNPGSQLSLRTNNDRAAKSALLGILNHPAPAFESIADFQRYHSYSHCNQRTEQPKWFRSYAYFCHIKGQPGAAVRPDGGEAERLDVESEGVVDQIIVAFRGTWIDSSASGEWLREDDGEAEVASKRSWYSRIWTWVKNKMTPSSKYGLSDFYYDAMLIRIPYRKGTIWKWYAYWGSLILERTEWAPRCFRQSRTVAKDWMVEPKTHTSEPNGGHVHLGFWSLWASPEGFAGYNQDGTLSTEDSVIRSIQQALGSAERRKADIVVYVVGHSLGGAVSSFAALDIARELEKYPRATMQHVTFGSPPVGTANFETYFHSQLGRHGSWRVSHDLDLISQCFAWCASKWYLGWLKWWSDWSCVGVDITREVISSKSSIAAEKNHEVGFFGKCKFGLAGFVSLGTLYVLSLLAIPVSTVAYLRNRSYYGTDISPQEDQDSQSRPYEHGKPPTVRPNVGLEYHSLQKYIDLMAKKAEEMEEQERERELLRNDSITSSGEGPSKAAQIDS